MIQVKPLASRLALSKQSMNVCCNDCYYHSGYFSKQLWNFFFLNTVFKQNPDTWCGRSSGGRRACPESAPVVFGWFFLFLFLGFFFRLFRAAPAACGGS